MGVRSRREENVYALQRTMAGRQGILSLGNSNYLPGVQLRSALGAKETPQR